MAEQLRREHGYSYNEISEQVSVSKSTLSGWLKQISLTLEQEQRIQQQVEANQTAFVAKSRKTNALRFHNARRQAFQQGADVASVIPDNDNDAVHELALAMLYVGEEDKTGNRVQIANTDPDVLRYFLVTVESLYQIDRSDMSFRLNLVEVARPFEEQMIKWWASKLMCSVNQFRKTQFDVRSKHASISDDYHGVCTLTYNDTYLYTRLTGVYSTYFDGRLGK